MYADLDLLLPATVSLPSSAANQGRLISRYRLDHLLTSVLHLYILDISVAGEGWALALVL